VQRQTRAPVLTFEMLLEQSIDPKVDKHWSDKIRHGIIPTELLLLNHVDMKWFWAEVKKAADFEHEMFFNAVLALKNRIKDSKLSLRDKETHYIGIGRGEGLEAVTREANEQGMEIFAYDTSVVACNNAEQVFAKLLGKREDLGKNKVFHGDIEFICRPEVIGLSAGIVVLPNILDVLNKVSKDHFKLLRTCRSIGTLLACIPTLVLLAIFRRPEDNPNAIWGDTEPISETQLAGWMRTDQDEGITVEVIGQVTVHGHVHTAALFTAQ
jgi:hypothetical protein